MSMRGLFDDLADAFLRASYYWEQVQDFTQWSSSKEITGFELTTFWSDAQSREWYHFHVYTAPPLTHLSDILS